MTEKERIEQEKKVFRERAEEKYKGKDPKKLKEVLDLLERNYGCLKDYDGISVRELVERVMTEGKGKATGTVTVHGMNNETVEHFKRRAFVRSDFVKWIIENEVTIQIIAEPESPPEVPEFVRKSWIGLILPGVLSIEKLAKVSPNFGEKETGYLILVEKALGELEKNSPDAAKWWRENDPSPSFPWFRFNKECCKILD